MPSRPGLSPPHSFRLTQTLQKSTNTGLEDCITDQKAKPLRLDSSTFTSYQSPILESWSLRIHFSEVPYSAYPTSYLQIPHPFSVTPLSCVPTSLYLTNWCDNSITSLLKLHLRLQSSSLRKDSSPLFTSAARVYLTWIIPSSHLPAHHPKITPLNESHGSPPHSSNHSRILRPTPTGRDPPPTAQIRSSTCPGLPSEAETRGGNSSSDARESSIDCRRRTYPAPNAKPR